MWNIHMIILDHWGFTPEESLPESSRSYPNAKENSWKRRSRDDVCRKRLKATLNNSRQSESSWKRPCWVINGFTKPINVDVNIGRREQLNHSSDNCGGILKWWITWGRNSGWARSTLSPDLVKSLNRGILLRCNPLLFSCKIKICDL